VPTDCPQRDERLGWTGDAQAFIRTSTYQMNENGVPLSSVSAISGIENFLGNGIRFDAGCGTYRFEYKLA